MKPIKRPVNVPENALEMRMYRDHRTSFAFYITGPKRKGYYPIYRWINSLNGPGSYQDTMGAEDWVERAETVEVYK